MSNHIRAGESNKQKKRIESRPQAGWLLRELGLLLLIVVSLGLSWIYLGSTGEKESWRFVWIGLGWATGLSANVDTRDAKWGAVFAGQIQLMLLVISLVCLGLPQKPLLFLLVWLCHTSAIMMVIYLDVASVTKRE